MADKERGRLFLAAAKTGARDELAALLAEDRELLHYCGAGTPDAVLGSSALHWASAKGHEACVKFLLSSRADPHLRNHGDSTPLSAAATNNHAGCARALMRAGADPLLKDEYGDSPLHLAERAQHVAVVAVLREGAAPAGPARPPLRAAPTPVPAQSAGRRSAYEHKESGNACFKDGAFDAAYAHYSAALALSQADQGASVDEARGTLLSNRSGALAGAARWQEAEEDAHAAVALRPEWFKGHSRLGAALEGLGELSRAIEAYGVAADLEGAGEVTAAALKRARAAFRAQRLESLFERASVADGSVGGEKEPTAAEPAKPERTAEELAYRGRVAAWHGAAKRGDVAALELQLAEFPELLHNRSENTAEKLLGNAALHWAAAFGHDDAASWLLEQGCAGHTASSLTLRRRRRLRATLPLPREGARTGWR
ncbi:ankyrin repeat-containing domain protein [Pavlovales sp. CCMP2436]|nr:ankyrin repeat-containing domain protein [Pavlovales sp. CCMP2436]